MYKMFGVWEAGKCAVAKIIWYKPWAAELGRAVGAVALTKYKVLGHSSHDRPQS